MYSKIRTSILTLKSYAHARYFIILLPRLTKIIVKNATRLIGNIKRGDVYLLFSTATSIFPTDPKAQIDKSAFCAAMSSVVRSFTFSQVQLSHS
jgi:hypothetical protein